MKKLTLDIFLKKAKKIHKNTYDYSLVDYKNSRTKINVICRTHGVFEVLPMVHLRGSKCKLCVNNNIKYDTNTFIRKAIEIHGTKYLYDLVDYINNETKIKIICPEHGEFEQTPNSHLSGNGCILCSGLKRMTNDEFIQKSIIIHNNKYDYSLVNYINNKTKVKIICPEHGLFEQKPINHIILKQGCYKCSKNKKLNTEEFIKKSSKIHNNFYDYSLVNYINTEIKIKIICPEHGIFNQTPHNHLSGNGCPHCFESSGEKIVKSFLIQNNIIFEINKKFEGCKYKNSLRFDFYLPEFNCVIEFDGKQHFLPYDFYGGKNALKLIKLRDNIKNEYCKNNNIKMIRLNDIKKINIILEKKLNKNG